MGPRRRDGHASATKSSQRPWVSGRRIRPPPRTWKGTASGARLTRGTARSLDRVGAWTTASGSRARRSPGSHGTSCRRGRCGRCGGGRPVWCSPCSPPQCLSQAPGTAAWLPAAVILVLAQVVVLRWQVRAPIAVLAVTVATGLAVWVLLPEVSLTGALLAAQVALCTLSATGSRRVSVRALAAMCLPAPLAFGAGGGPAGVTVYLLAVLLAWTAGQWRRRRPCPCSWRRWHCGRGRWPPESRWRPGTTWCSPRWSVST